MSSDDSDEEVHQRQRDSFEKNLIEEGLELEAVNGYGLVLTCFIREKILLLEAYLL